MALADTVQEARRLMIICNACRYCEGHCATMRAMERRLSFSEQDLRYLAALCHNCGSCFHHCQYAPPQEFDVNVPRVFTELRRHSYELHAWPRPLGRLFSRNGVATGLVAAAACVLSVVAGSALAGPAILEGHRGPGAFYRVVPHGLLVALLGVAFSFAAVALAIGCHRFWRAAGEPEPGRTSRGRAFLRATRDAASLRNLDGGGDGCTYPREAPSMARRWFHHLTSYGFLLCFASTTVAAAFDWLGVQAPYPPSSLPVVLGTAGGIGLVVGPVGLLVLKVRADEAPYPRTGMDVSFLVLLLLTSVTGLLLLALRETAAMGFLLLVHLGVVMGVFLTLPYGKFVHAVHRYAALFRYAIESSRPPPQSPKA